MIEKWYWDMIVRDKITGLKGRVESVDFYEQVVNVKTDSGIIPMPIKNLEDITDYDTRRN